MLRNRRRAHLLQKPSVIAALSSYVPWPPHTPDLICLSLHRSVWSSYPPPPHLSLPSPPVCESLEIRDHVSVSTVVPPRSSAEADAGWACSGDSLTERIQKGRSGAIGRDPKKAALPFALPPLCSHQPCGTLAPSFQPGPINRPCSLVLVRGHGLVRMDVLPERGPTLLNRHVIIFMCHSDNIHASQKAVCCEQQSNSPLDLNLLSLTLFWKTVLAPSSTLSPSPC